MTKAEPPTGRPTAPGWYWVQAFDDSPWYVTRVIATRGQLCAIDPHLDIAHPIALVDPFWDDVRWRGPIMPEDLDDRRRLDFLSNTEASISYRSPPDIPWWICWISPAKVCHVGRMTPRSAIDAAMAESEIWGQSDD